MKKIEHLTDDQASQFDEFRDKWIDIGLCTEPADRTTAETAIRRMYRSAGLDEPQKIVWCGSPRAAVRDAVKASGGASVLAAVRSSVRAAVRSAVRAAVRDSVRDSVWSPVGNSVRDSVWSPVWSPVWASVGSPVGSAGYGQHDANWLSFYDFFRSACGLRDETERCVGLIDQAQSSGWYLPHARICWVSERPSVLRRDERGQLHCVSGPAMVYPDGWSIYAIHGVRVPEDLAGVGYKKRLDK